MDIKRAILVSTLLNTLMIFITTNVFISKLILSWYYSKGTISVLTYSYIIFTIIPLIILSVLLSFWYFKGKIEINIKQGAYLGLIFIVGSFIIKVIYHLIEYRGLEVLFASLNLSYFNIVIETLILLLIPVGVGYVMRKN